MSGFREIRDMVFRRPSEAQRLGAVAAEGHGDQLVLAAHSSARRRAALIQGIFSPL